MSKIKLVNKSVFNINCDAVINTVNCVGVMGKGLALEFALRYPGLEYEYINDCGSGALKIGVLTTYQTDDFLIINFPTKDNWKNKSKVEWISLGLDYLVSNYKKWNIKSIAIPPLGCGLGGLDFERDIKQLIIDKLSNIDLDIYICFDPVFAEGKEKIMVDAFNNINKYYLCHALNINNKAKDSLIYCEKIYRFYDLLKLDGIGKEIYKKIFNYFYRNEEINVQFSLFDLASE